MESVRPIAAGTAREPTCGSHSVAKTFAGGRKFGFFGQGFHDASAGRRDRLRAGHHHPSATGDGHP
ncbi:MAG: hypothetical protein ABEI96_01040 [Haloarculaceae archaeon]